MELLTNHSNNNTGGGDVNLDNALLDNALADGHFQTLIIDFAGLYFQALPVQTS